MHQPETWTTAPVGAAETARVERAGDGPRIDEVVAVHPEPPQRVAATLARLGMPSREIASVLAVDEPLVLGRYFELHRERMKEALAEQLQALAEIERVLALGILRRDLHAAGVR